jgi:transcriptional regulator with XRE-family HTH domain
MSVDNLLSDRIRLAIIKNGGYELISDNTGISVSTLKRTSAGGSEPKFKDVVAIAEATGVPLIYLTYGENDFTLEHVDKMVSSITQFIKENASEAEIAAIKMMIGMMVGGIENNINQIASAANNSNNIKDVLNDLKGVINKAFEKL